MSGIGAPAHLGGLSEWPLPTPLLKCAGVAGALQSLRRSGGSQLRDRFSFMRFLGLELEDAVPDAKTLWLYREALANAGAVEELFDLFDGFLNNGYLAMGGQIIDAAIVSAPKQQRKTK